MLCEALELEGYRVDLAKDGEEGDRQLQQQSFDLVITDIFMPEKDGLEIIRTMKSKSDTTPIIAITGDASRPGETLPYSAAAAISFGADQFFVKPIVIKDLLASVASLIPNIGEIH